jgi:hypothetical protein
MKRALLVTIPWLLAAGPPAAGPQYDHEGRLLRPRGYREWKFIGANYGMGYSEHAAPKKDPTFHNIYIQPESFREFAATGRFPDKTILVMEVYRAGTNASINRQGAFQDAFLGVEAAVKDEQRFPEKWAYFNFIGGGGKEREAAAAFPKQACWSCHNEHGAADNVFVQFYPLLREARK